MREINVNNVRDTVARLCISSNVYANDDIVTAYEKAKNRATSPLERDICDIFLRNTEVAKLDGIPICQDTGMAVVFLDIGQDVRITGGYIEDAVNDGVRDGYVKGYLRKSVVKDPIDRVNTGDNTPAVIHYNITKGDRLIVTVAPKGFGSENKSALRMLNPSDGIEGVKEFVVETVKKAGASPCPPVVVGVGIGGTIEKCAYLAKTALLREIGQGAESPYWANVERELLDEINALHIGACGFGGDTTTFAVHINVFAAHIASLPVCVNIGCHVTRHGTAEVL